MQMTGKLADNWKRFKPKFCPAFGKLCNNCGKSNHYAKCCKAATRQKVHTVEGDEDEFIVNVVQTCATEKEEWIVPIELNQTIIPFKLDTVAHVKLISLKDYKTLTVKSKNKSEWVHWRTCSCQRQLHSNFHIERSTDKSTTTVRGYECSTNPGSQCLHKAQSGKTSVCSDIVRYC